MVSFCSTLRITLLSIGLPHSNTFSPVELPMHARDAAETPSLFASRRTRFAISVLVIGHLWAVVGRPFEFATQGPFGTSPSASMFFQPVRGYSQFAYLDHGYAFFAPEPGPSHFFQAALKPPQGERFERKFPDLSDQWPRLLYHRHFMLAEFLNDVYHPPGEPPAEIAADALAAAQWRQGRKRYEDIRDSILNHLRAEHPRCEVAIRRVEHRQPGLPEFLQDGTSIRDERLLQVLLDAAIDANALPGEEIPGPPESLMLPPAEPIR